MDKKRFYIAVYFGIAAVSLGSIFYYYKNRADFQDERVSHIFKLRDLNNDQLKPIKSDFIIINFWASWCPPCIEETPSLVRFTEKYAQHFTLIALSQDTTKKEIEDFIKTFPALRSRAINIVHDDSQSVARSYKVEQLPETFIYSVKENKYFRVSGATNWDQPEVVTTLNKYFNISL